MFDEYLQLMSTNHGILYRYYTIFTRNRKLTYELFNTEQGLPGVDGIK